MLSLIALCIIVLLFNFLAPTAFSGMIVAIGRPFWFVGNRIGAGFSYTTSSFRSKAALMAERDKLLVENGLLRASLAERDILQDENNLLKAAFSRNDKGPKLVFANVISHPGLVGYDTLILDVGSNNKLEEGNRVLLSDGVVIGRLERVSNSTSRAVLFSNPGTETAVLIGSASSTTALTAVGQGSGDFLVKLPKGVSVNVGAPVRIAGNGDMVLSSVEKIENDPADSYQRIYFKLPIRPNLITSVFIDPTFYADTI